MVFFFIEAMEQDFGRVLRKFFSRETVKLEILKSELLIASRVKYNFSF